MVNGFCQSTIVVNGFSMFFYMWTIGVDGLSMVLGKVKAGSHKRPKYKKKHDLFNKYLGVINNL